MSSMGMKSENIAHFNNKLILNMLLSEPLSCVELAEKTDLSHMATGRILRRLSEMDIVKPYVEPPKKRSRGRQFFRYEINAERAYYACVNLQHFNESFIVYDLAGNVVVSEKLSSSRVDDEYIYNVIDRIKGVFAEKALPLDRLAVVSAAVPGRLNDESGELIVSSKIDSRVNLIKTFEKAFPSSLVEIKNDIDYACIYSILSGEFDYGKGTHLYLYVGSGVACCLVNDRKIISGSNGFGGEIGMNHIDQNGNRLHAAVASSEMLETCKKISGKGDLTFADLDKVCESYPKIKEKFLSVADILGNSICNCVDMLGCSHVIFAGDITCYPKFFFDRFLSKLKETNYSERINYKLDFSKSEETSGGQMLVARLASLDWVMEQY